MCTTCQICNRCGRGLACRCFPSLLRAYIRFLRAKTIESTVSTATPAANSSHVVRFSSMPATFHVGAVGSSALGVARSSVAVVVLWAVVVVVLAVAVVFACSVSVGGVSLSNRGAVGAFSMVVGVFIGCRSCRRLLLHIPAWPCPRGSLLRKNIRLF